METARELAQRLVDQLNHREFRIVLAESCTAGLVAATMGQIPGVSDVLCGSAVTYRTQTKIAWLDVDPDMLALHTAVSAQASEAMARSVLQKTPEAHVAVTITGHLGPDAPPELDGLVFVCATLRSTATLQTKQMRLQSSDRMSRQQEATQVALQHAIEAIR